MLRWAGRYSQTREGGHQVMPGTSHDLKELLDAFVVLMWSGREREGWATTTMETVVWDRWRLMAGDEYQMTSVEGLEWPGGRAQDMSETCDLSILPPPFLPFLSFPHSTRTCDADAFTLEIF